MKQNFSDIFLLATVVLICMGGIYLSQNTNSEVKFVKGTAEIVTPVYKFGLDKSKHWFEDYHIKSGAVIGDILMNYGVDFEKIIDLERKAEDIYSLRRIKAGKNITLVRTDSCANPKMFIYPLTKLSFARYEFGDDVKVSLHEKPYEVCIEGVTGVVESNVYNSMIAQGKSEELADKLEDALGQISFQYSQRGDQYKLIYEQIYVEGKPSGTGRLLSASYKSGAKEDFAFYYENDVYQGYYDIDGNPNKKTFLSTPVRGSRITSSYNPNRFHPILKRRRPHLGTDYGARHGTKIQAVADGVVTKRSYTKGNGYYVKIRHDKVYESQYLHMSRFVKNVRVGTRVSQGQTIGYVGSTGLATGPHVCFRFWKNGKQIDHRRENFPPKNPMPQEELPAYFAERDNHLEYLNSVQYSKKDVAFASLGPSESENSAD